MNTYSTSERLIRGGVNSNVVRSYNKNSYSNATINILLKAITHEEEAIFSLNQFPGKQTDDYLHHSAIDPYRSRKNLKPGYPYSDGFGLFWLKHGGKSQYHSG
ncbi:hypothetical protein [Pantoea sp. B65]|uniref:hypothetical protein n=1 Tax=Pantoea sp. B65 TaxID=2813359 RepID=UPI0039B660DF